MSPDLRRRLVDDEDSAGHVGEAGRQLRRRDQHVELGIPRDVGHPVAGRRRIDGHERGARLADGQQRHVGGKGPGQNDPDARAVAHAPATQIVRELVGLALHALVAETLPVDLHRDRIGKAVDAALEELMQPLWPNRMEEGADVRLRVADV